MHNFKTTGILKTSSSDNFVTKFACLILAVTIVPNPITIEITINPKPVAVKVLTLSVTAEPTLQQLEEVYDGF